MKKITAIAEEEQAKKQERELRRIYRLSQRAYWPAVLVGLLFPLGAYLYTQRWRALGLSFLSISIVAVFLPADPDADIFSPDPTLTVIYGLVAAGDNAKAIHWARQKVQVDEDT